MNIYITQYSGIYAREASPLTLQMRSESTTLPVFRLSKEDDHDVENRFGTATKSHPSGIERFDRVTKLALAASKNVVEKINRTKSLQDLVVIAASARGATGITEDATRSFLDTGKVSALTSPLTTAGGIASTVAHFVSPGSLGIGTSMTCASFFESLLIARALLLSGTCSKALVVGAEAPLTPFTIAQMLALKIYTRDYQTPLPCKPFNSIVENRNQFVLGEGAAAFLLETEQSLETSGNIPLVSLEQIGFCQEHDETLTGMNREGDGFLQAMSSALKQSGKDPISGQATHTPDLVIAHAPGTIAGDLAERNALERFFGNELPPVLSTKFFTGHTFGASAALSMSVALDLMLTDKRIVIPFDGFMNESFAKEKSNHKPCSALINAAGFGGVVLSTFLKRL